MKNVKLINLKKAVNEGILVFGEGLKEIPFVIKRVYYIFDVPNKAVRGRHAHRTLDQFLICVRGSLKILVDDSIKKEEIILDSPFVGMYLGPGVWHEMYDFSSDALLLVLAAEHYDEKDYIRKYDEFIKYKKGE